jgi:HTH-type transcriptional regulator/antitoxin HipB
VDALEPDEFLTAELGFPMFRRGNTPVKSGHVISVEKIKKLRTRFEMGIGRPQAAKQCGVTWQTVDRYYGFWGSVPKRKVRPATRVPWLRSEKQTLRALYPSSYQPAIEAALPRHPWGSIMKMANSLGLKRPRAKVTSAIEVIRDLRAARERRGLTRKQVAQKLGIHPQFLTGWERGSNAPRFTNLIKWCGALGVTLRIYDRSALNVEPIMGRFEPRRSQ